MDSMNLKQLLGLCEHKYKTLRRVTVTEKYSGATTAFDYELQCEKCGVIKVVRT